MHLCRIINISKLSSQFQLARIDKRGGRKKGILSGPELSRLFLVGPRGRMNIEKDDHIHPSLQRTWKKSKKLCWQIEEWQSGTASSYQSVQTIFGAWEGSLHVGFGKCQPTTEQKKRRADILKKLLKKIQADQKKNCCHHFDPKNEWIIYDLETTFIIHAEQIQTSKSVGKVMGLRFPLKL